MAVQTAIAFATTFLENDHVFTLHEGSLHLANYLCAFNGRRANCNGTVGVNKKNLAKLNRVTGLFLFTEIVDVQFLAGFGFELLSLNVYNSVHLNYCISS